MNRIEFTTIDGRSTGFYWLVAALAVAMVAGLWSAHHMDSQGHHVTGMTNQIVWGLPHVLAVFLIVCASGALHGASLASVFGQRVYRPYARLSVLLAIALLLGGLAVITLDLGRPERLVIALTHFNKKSVFSWNVLFYSGFVALGVFYLWALMDRRLNQGVRTLGTVLLVWRLLLTTATGLIFGVLTARQAYDAAIMAPLFIAMSLSLGTAAYSLLLSATTAWTGRPLEPAAVNSLRRWQDKPVEDATSDFAVPFPRPVEALAAWITRTEVAVEKRVDLPFGVSLYGVLRKPAA